MREIHSVSAMNGRTVTNSPQRIFISGSVCTCFTMDEESLHQILQDANDRQFWIVLWAYSELSADEGKQVFDEPVYEEGLTRNVPDIRIGTFCLFTAFMSPKSIYVSEVIEPPRKSTAQEIKKDAWRKRWTWAIRARNMSPEYGRYWNRCGERTFNLAREFNQLHPNGPSTYADLTTEVTLKSRGTLLNSC